MKNLEDKELRRRDRQKKKETDVNYWQLKTYNLTRETKTNYWNYKLKRRNLDWK